MEPHELIARAKSQFWKILPADLPPLSLANYPRVLLRETALVSFESDSGKDRVFMIVDRSTGDFIGGGLTAPDRV